MATPAATLPRTRRRVERSGGLVALVRDYAALTRPRVLALVLLTAPPALAMGRSGWPDAATVLGVLLGALLVGGGCAALNAWYERDVDALMERTRERPLPAGRLRSGEALAFGLAISALGLGVLFGTGGWLPALVAALTLLHYVGIYTAWLKPRSVWNTVVGAAAGAAAPLIADAAADGRIGPWGLVLFAIVFLWQPPHVWAINLYRQREYAAAGLPTLPGTLGPAATRRRMLAWSLALIPVTLLPWLAGALGAAYGLCALAGGAWFASSILRAVRAASQEADRRVFRTSVLYLFVVFAAMLVDLVAL